MQSLDAAKRKHEAARGVDEIGTDTQCARRFCRRNHFATGSHSNAPLQRITIQQIDDQRQAFPNGQADIDHQAHGCCACAIVAPVDGDEVGRAFAAALMYQLEQVLKLPAGADNRESPASGMF